MEIVIDTNVMISGLLSPVGVPGKILDLWDRGGFDIVMSLQMLDELKEVLAYHKIKKRFLESGSCKNGHFCRYAF